MVGQRKACVALRCPIENTIEQGFYELVQVVDLLELAACVLVQLAFACQDVQLFEQLDGLSGAQLFNDLWLVFGFLLHALAV